MAKLNGPLHSLEAHGALGDGLTFSKRKSGQQVRHQHKQKYADSAAQEAANTAFAQAFAAWRTLSDADKLEWHNFNKS